ncbi:hypothetical protein [Mycobacterium sp. RTGN5]|nr:hypothetical protein [Mycobacterium sp. RTGN5]
MIRILSRLSRAFSMRSDASIKHDVRRLSRAFSTRSDASIKHAVVPLI